MLRWGGRNSVRVILLLLTPRGGAYWSRPEEGLASFWPNRYTDAINRVNDGLRVRARLPAAPTLKPWFISACAVLRAPAAPPLGARVRQLRTRETILAP